MTNSTGKIFRTLVQQQAPLPVLGTINAYCAKLAENAGCQAIYLSGAGVANATYGLPDLGMTNLSEVLADARHITEACPLPLLVDLDTGWGHNLNIARAIKLMEHADVAAVHIEDQQTAKRCGHRPNKTIISAAEMSDRIKAAVDARIDPDFIIIARTDAYANEGMNAALERAQFYVEVGADMIFPEAITTLADFARFVQTVRMPILANCTEFGKTPLFTRTEFQKVGVQLILYPLSAFRAMSQAALRVYQTILQDGTQKNILSTMQTRDDLYKILNYLNYEQKLDLNNRDLNNSRE